MSPAPVTAGSAIAAANGADTLDLGGTITPLGMNLPFNAQDPASGTAPPGRGGRGRHHRYFRGRGHRHFRRRKHLSCVRSGTINSSPATAGLRTGQRLEQLFVQPDTQGAEFALPTTGYNNVYVTLDWFSTHSGEQDAQRQYSLDGGTTWVNLGPQIQLLAAGNDDWYGDSALNGITPVTFDLTAIPAANNNANLAVRLVNSATAWSCPISRTSC